MQSLNERVFIAGHRGMVGSAVVRRLKAAGCTQLILAERSELDLCRQEQVEAFFQRSRPETVIFAAARVGGILANASQPAPFLYENLVMAAHAVHAAWMSGVKRFLYLGSSCIYPRDAPQPIPESALLTGPLERTNEAYAIAKIAGLKLCQFYRQQYGVTYHSVMPTNLYGPGDNYHPDHSHVLPGLIRRFHEAQAAGKDSVTIWGTGTPRREFLHVDDLAAAIEHLLSLDDPPDVVNAGSGHEVTIRELAEIVAEVVGFTGEIRTDPDRPDGVARKLTDSTWLRSAGWSPRIGLREGIAMAYEDFRARLAGDRLRTV